MAEGNENQAKGALDKVKGEAKDQYGKLTNDKTKQASGKKDKAKGEVKQKFGKAQEKSNKDKNS